VLVAEEVQPVIVVEIGRDGGAAPVARLHELEEDVVALLFPPEIEITQSRREDPQAGLDEQGPAAVLEGSLEPTRVALLTVLLSHRHA
jgi:hypothetical protein